MAMNIMAIGKMASDPQKKRESWDFINGKRARPIMDNGKMI